MGSLSSGRASYRGVWEDKRRRRWKTRIWIHSKGITHLGSFTTEEEAARAYDRVSIAYHGRREAFTNFPLAEYESEWAALEGMPLTDAIALVKRRAEEDRRSARKPATPPASAARPPQSPRTTALLGVAAQAFADSSFSNRSPQPVDVFSLRVPKRPRSGPVASRAASVESAEPSAGDVPAEKPLRVLRHCASPGARRQQDSPTSVFGLYPGSEDGSERGSAPDHKADGAADGAADGGLHTPGTATPTGSEAGGAGGA